MNKEQGLKIALTGLIVGVLYASFVAPLTVKEKLIKSTNIHHAQAYN